MVKQLEGLGYTFASSRNEEGLLANLKAQLEAHNRLSLTDKEFEKVVNHLDRGLVFDRAKTLLDRMLLHRADGTSVYLSFLNQEHWCQNRFQLTRQVSVEGAYKNRYDLSLLINGLPLAHIELKRRGLELKEAFNQIKRYQGESFGAMKGLYRYVQLFVISNGVNTKYYANNREQSFEQTFYWTDEANRRITQLKAFADAFLTPCKLAKMLCRYTVLAEATHTLLVLRPYQYYAVEKLIERVKTTCKSGYIWHTTGSGKTLTAFKASQLLMKLSEVHKVVFVVDRKDLDYQTTREFNSFSAGSVDGTDDTRTLVRQFSGDTRLIVTTLQKLNRAIRSTRHAAEMKPLRDRRVVFLFDECHRSQFGETHARIKGFFQKHQLFGFTGTPIFVENAV